MTPARCRHWRRVRRRLARSTTADDGDGRAHPVHEGLVGSGGVGVGSTRLVKAVGVCAALGGSSAYTWLKIQATADIAVGGVDDDATVADSRRRARARSRRDVPWWEQALAQPTVRGLVVGRALLYPADGDVEARRGPRRRPRDRRGSMTTAVRLTRGTSVPSPP